MQPKATSDKIEGMTSKILDILTKFERDARVRYPNGSWSGLPNPDRVWIQSNIDKVKSEVIAHEKSILDEISDTGAMCSKLILELQEQVAKLQGKVEGPSADHYEIAVGSVVKVSGFANTLVVVKRFTADGQSFYILDPMLEGEETITLSEKSIMWSYGK